MKAKSARKLTLFILVVGILLNIYEPLRGVSVIVVISSLIPAFFFNRCPHCRKYLGRNNGDFCQHCGTKIE